MENTDNYHGSGPTTLGFKNSLHSIIYSVIIKTFFSAPSAVKQPNVNIVYAAQSQSNIQLQADVTGNGIKFVQWKFNGTGIRQGENGITVSTGSHISTGLIATLTISSYSSPSHLGTFEVLATSQAGTAVVASWLFRDAGIITGEIVDQTVASRTWWNFSSLGPHVVS